MIFKNTLYLWIYLLLTSLSLSASPIAEQLRLTGYVEICDVKQEEALFATLYNCFEEFIDFLQTNPYLAQRLYSAKERFIRTKDRNFYSTDFFGFYDESKNKTRSQIAFYYSTHFHDFVCSQHPEFNKIPEIFSFFEVCREIQKPYGELFYETATELGLETIFLSKLDRPPVLFKVVKYLATYTVTTPHYDGTAFSLFLDSTDNDSLLLSPYKFSLTVEDFYSPKRSRKDSILLIPGALLAEYFLFPTPHIVKASGKVRYASILFAMRPNFIYQKNDFAPLPKF